VQAGTGAWTRAGTSAGTGMARLGAQVGWCGASASGRCARAAHGGVPERAGGVGRR
jgi:hypothetical protein